MSVLSDAEIAGLCTAPAPLIEPFREEHLTPNGYDLSVNEIHILATGEDRLAEGQTTINIPPGNAFLVSTVEYLRIPNGLTGTLWLRSSWARKGVVASFGMVDAGFQGNLTFGAHYLGHRPLVMELPVRFAQIVFTTMSKAAGREYRLHSGNYYGQRGLTHARG